MDSRPAISSVMTTHPHSIQKDAYLNSAKVMLTQYEIQQLPVMDGRQVVGVISVADLARAEAMGVDSSIGSEARVDDVYNHRVYAVGPDEFLDDVLVYMGMAHIDATLVMAHDQLVGIFTVSDACRHYAGLIRQTCGESGSKPDPVPA